MGSDGTVYAQTNAKFMFMKLLQAAHYNAAAAQHGAVTLHSVGHVHHAMFAQQQAASYIHAMLHRQFTVGNVSVIWEDAAMHAVMLVYSTLLDSCCSGWW